MRLFVGITDGDWHRQLSDAKPDEVNFWKPGESGSFRALEPGEMFLFKLHAPRNYIVGGAHFVRFSRLPVSLAWLAFGEKNGVRSPEEFRRRIERYRKTPPGPDPTIGNIVLSNPFWFEQDQWIPAPADWPGNTVQGKGYDLSSEAGHMLWEAVAQRLGGTAASSVRSPGRSQYGVSRSRVRLGQGGFRVVVTEAYCRRCAITGENTLPVLEAAHIQPYAQNGPHAIENGILLRSDMHILFDKGLITVTPDLKIEVSSQIREQYSNGKRYYAYHGQDLRTVPEDEADQPAGEFLAWHNEKVFVA